jgi:tRNA-splicing ligase RtcB (3'-phosphate/5'-hydroxy nucleic acid ligase)
VFHQFFPEHRLEMLFDVSHNICKEETHQVDGARRSLFVHRKGATRAFGPGHPALPASLLNVGQPVLVGGTMGTASYVLAGTRESESHEAPLAYKDVAAVVDCAHRAGLAGRLALLKPMVCIKG